MLKTLVVSKIKNIPLETNQHFFQNQEIPLVPIFFQSPNSNFFIPFSKRRRRRRNQQLKSKKKKSKRKKIKNIPPNHRINISFRTKNQLHFHLPFSSIPKHPKTHPFSVRKKKKNPQNIPLPRRTSPLVAPLIQHPQTF